MKKLYKPLRFFCLAFALILIQCKDANKGSDSENLSASEQQEVDKDETKMNIEQSNFGETADGKSVEHYTISNASGLEMSVISYGGIITSLKVPNKNGDYENVVLGFDNIKDYEDGSPYFGAIIGRYGNRIAGGKFTLDGKEYNLDTNDGPNSLHGGEKGFDKVVWDVASSTEGNTATLELSYTSKDGEGGFPGNLKTTVTYTLNSDNELDIKYEATTDKKTIVNLTQHSYFNLSGDFSKKILDHVVEINADEFLPVDKTLIPTGELKPVKGTPFDFSEPTTIAKGLELEGSNEQLDRGPGFDHCWVLNGQDSGKRFAASAYEPDSGRFMEVYTNEPALQFYIGNFLDGSLPASGGGTYEKRTGFCMETQHYPDSPNQENFSSTVLEPEEKYTSETSYKFSVK
ncbi:aldose epimerase family protein [Christiangramia forsetii]|uniref:Aldose 1-epimerase n=2 Tax=Christiangramia forsetii TaxID=411153 RepID=A0LZ82_CHRFK|nr:aldose epimerase family protein [Christiangramia forsetii]GGG37696.1 aldose 1-epimerase [Christiangramia forsetii]CAL65677.1 aldose 1-epimerase [Christiangramia forsetii KT0803]